MKRLVIAGSSGFLGSSFRNVFEQEQVPVTGFASSSSFINIGEKASDDIDIGLPVEEIAERLIERKINVGINAATYFSKTSYPQDIQKMIAANLDFSIRFLEACILANVQQFISLNSYWQLPSLAPSRAEAESAYTASKKAYAAYAECRKHNFSEFLDLYVTDTFGPGDRRMKLIPLLLKSEREGTKLPLQNPTRPLMLTFSHNLALFVLDLVQGVGQLPPKALYVNYVHETPISLQNRIEGILTNQTSPKSPDEALNSSFGLADVDVFGLAHDLSIDDALRITAANLP